MVEEVAVFCTASLDAALQSAAEAQGVRLETSTLSSLRDKIATTLRVRPVVLIIKNSKEASRAFAFGVDEVLRSWDVTAVTLGEAMERARARAAARLTSTRFVSEVAEHEGATAFQLLTKALYGELAPSVVSASASCEELAHRIARLIESNTKLAEWASLVAPAESLRALMASGASIHSTREVTTILRNVSGSLRRAESLVENLRSFSRGREDGGSVDVARLLGEVADLLRSEVRPWADLVVVNQEPCALAVSCSFVVSLIGALVGNAVDSIRASGRWDQERIELTATQQDGALVLEVRDTGSSELSDSASVLEPGLDESSMDRRLVRLRHWLRAMGGDLFWDHDGSGSSVRAFVPVEVDQPATGMIAEEDASETKPRRDLD
jgi:signal transduction histidine kinase